MDDKRIEEMLRESWQPQPPEGMRERVLGRAREPIRPRQAWFARSWRTAFALAGVMITILCFTSDSARQARLAKLDGYPSPCPRTLVASRPVTIADWRAELDRLTRPTGNQR